MFGKLRLVKFVASFILLCLSRNEHIIAQENIQDEIVKQIDDQLDFSEENIAGNEEITENLLHYYKNPIDINTATEEDFEKLGILTCFKIAMIIDYRKKSGPFASIYELNGVDGLSPEDVKRILPFVKIGQTQITSQTSHLKQKIVISSGVDYPLQKGFTKDSAGESRYNWPPNFIKLRYKANWRMIDAGITLENDPGEQMFNKTNPVFDFYSAFAKYSGNNILREVIIGDFQANFGQGLVLWTGFSPGRISGSFQIRKSKEGFSPYTSFDENKYLRGISSRINIKNFNIYVFTSIRNIDATKNESDTLGNVLSVSSLKTSGIHILQTDLRDKKLLNEKSIGANVSFDRKRLKIGLTSCKVIYGFPFIPENKPENITKFRGTTWHAIGLNYLVRGRKYDISGEVAIGSTEGKAIITGLGIQLLEEANFSFQYRNFGKKYFSAFASALSQNPKANNEEGIYMGFEISPIAKLKIMTAADIYRNSWLSANLNESQSGSQYFIDTEFTPNLSSSLSIRYISHPKKIKDYSLKPEPYSSKLSNLQKVRLQSKFVLNENIELRNRVEFNFSELNQNGYLVYQDLIWKSEKPKLFVATRYAFFETDSWDTRIYAFENDLLYNFTFVPAYGKGSRMYVYIRSNIARRIDVSVKYAILAYFDRESIGSAENMIPGSQKNELSFQLFILL